MAVASIDDPRDPRLEPYRAVGDPELLREHNLFVAEGRFVVERLLRESPFRVHSLLVSPATARALADEIETVADECAVYISPPSLLEHLTGYDFHRGCLALAHRPAAHESMARVRAALDTARLVVVLDNVGNADNVGVIIRNAEAFGCAALILSPASCDPLYRRAIRVSMGAVLRLPVAKCVAWPGELAELRERGFSLVALTRDGEVSLSDVHADAPRTALIVGAEGSGITPEVLALADCHVRIPMAAHVDSLNVGTASGIALHWWFRSQ